MSDYEVDVIIAVHSSVRPVARAAASVLDHTRARVRVTVVAHNLDAQIIRERLGAWAEDPRVRLLSLQDGIPSPSGPMNLGFSGATAPFTVLLGSDDELEPAAIDSWLALQRQTDADAVLAKIRLANGSIDPYPPVRRGRRIRELDGEADRLAYRSAPLGLVSRTRFPALRLAEGLRSGEDLPYSLTVWFTGSNLAYDLSGPAYMVNGDAGDRVTGASRPLAEDFSFLEHLEALPWLRAAETGVREAVVVKLLRMHFFDALRAHLDSDRVPATLPDFRILLRRLLDLAPRTPRLLSRADRRVLDSIDKGRHEGLRALVERRDRLSSPSALIPRNPLLVFHPQAPFRILSAGFLIRRRG